jgi:hypothetical protein
VKPFILGQKAMKFLWQTLKVSTKKHELQSVKNSQYPDLKISGQYQRLTQASIDLINKVATRKPPVVDQLMIGTGKC